MRIECDRCEGYDLATCMQSCAGLDLIGPERSEGPSIAPRAQARRAHAGNSPARSDNSVVSGLGRGGAEDELDERAAEYAGHRTEHPLTALQREVLQLAANGFRTPDQARMLGCSIAAVADRKRMAVRALEARNVTHAVAKAIRLGVIA